jgi:hypothetical protein
MDLSLLLHNVQLVYFTCALLYLICSLIRAPYSWSEAEFLDVIGTKVFRVFLLAVHCLYINLKSENFPDYVQKPQWKFYVHEFGSWWTCVRISGGRELCANSRWKRLRSCLLITNSNITFSFCVPLSPISTFVSCVLLFHHEQIYSPMYLF